MHRVQPSRPVSATACRLLLLLLLAAALLFAQSFGAIHRILHAPGSGNAPVHAVAAAAGSDSGQPEADALLKRLVGGHAAGDCALIDHALQPAPIAAPLVLPTPGPFVPPPAPVLAGVMPTGHHSAFLARGPPSLPLRSASV